LGKLWKKKKSKEFKPCDYFFKGMLGAIGQYGHNFNTKPHDPRCSKKEFQKGFDPSSLYLLVHLWLHV
jgi:hypothetical protein